jgi:hypothetical protein
VEFNKLFAGYPLQREEIQYVMQGFCTKLNSAIPVLQTALNNAGEAQYGNPAPLHKAMNVFDGVIKELNTNATLAIVDAVREYSFPYIEASALYKTGGHLAGTVIISWDLFYTCRDAMFQGILTFTQWIVSVTPDS